MTEGFMRPVLFLALGTAINWVGNPSGTLLPVSFAQDEAPIIEPSMEEVPPEAPLPLDTGMPLMSDMPAAETPPEATVGDGSGVPDQTQLGPPPEEPAVIQADNQPMISTEDANKDPAPLSEESQSAIAVSDSPSSSGTSAAKLDPRVPACQQMRPSWAIEIAASLKALGGSPTIPNLAGGSVKAFSGQFEYQPKSWQKYGVFSFGPSLQVYVPDNRQQVSDSFLSMWSVGAQARYQARYFREQILVPYVGFGVEQVRYNFRDGVSGSALATGPTLGAMLLLNVLDPRSAADFYASYGALRSYLVGEFRSSSVSGGPVEFSGSSMYFGIRVEY